MTDDPRCCGSGTCIIDAAGRCWCGQQWNGTRMCHVPLPPVAPAANTGALHGTPAGDSQGRAPQR